MARDETGGSFFIEFLDVSGCFECSECSKKKEKCLTVDSSGSNILGELTRKKRSFGEGEKKKGSCCL